MPVEDSIQSFSSVIQTSDIFLDSQIWWLMDSLCCFQTCQVLIGIWWCVCVVLTQECFVEYVRKLYREDWLCQEASINKTKQGCANCPAFIDIEIKKLTKDTIKKDPHLRGSNPLTARINIHAVHNHSTQTTTWLTRLHPSEATKRKFLEYFAQGHGPAAARQLHIESI
jgi:hypothetical protein